MADHGHAAAAREVTAMAYNWAQLAFVEKWRLEAVRGPVIGMYRPEDKTFFDLRLKPGEGGVGKLAAAVEVHMVDAGDMLREKRIPLTSTVAVVIRVVASSVREVGADVESEVPPRGRRWLESGSRVIGTVTRGNDDTILLDIGLPVVVQLPEGGVPSHLRPGQRVEVSIAETPKGFLVV